MSSGSRLEQLQAEVDYYHDRVALLRAKRYRWGLGSNARLRDLEAALERARARLREERLSPESRGLLQIPARRM